MTGIFDKEVLLDIISNDTNKTPGLKSSSFWAPEMPEGEQTHTLAVPDDTKLCCPGCAQLCDYTLCWCGAERQHHDSDYDYHTFVPMGCDCYRDKTPPPKLQLPEDLPWDIL